MEYVYETLGISILMDLVRDAIMLAEKIRCRANKKVNCSRANGIDQFHIDATLFKERLNGVYQVHVYPMIKGETQWSYQVHVLDLVITPLILVIVIHYYTLLKNNTHKTNLILL